MPPRPYLRLARKLLDLWEQHQLYKPLLRPEYLDEISELFEVLRQADQRWQTAWDFDLHLILPWLDEKRQCHFQRLQRFVMDLNPFPEPHTVVPTLRDLLAEIEQLQEEFGEVSINWKRRHLTVTTEPIQLQDVELGPFSINLRWEDWAVKPSVTCFDIVAIDPNPAGINEGVTHPHVKDEDLCAGDAVVPIRQALASGRLAEAFLLVRSVLTTYNPRSAHVPLDQWNGTFCADCGESVDSSETYQCSGCDSDYCDGCTTSCGVCDETRCFGCTVRCAECDDPCCPSCLLTVGGTDQECCTQCAVTCPVCSEVVLRSDYDAQAERCQACLTESTPSSDSPTSPPTSEESDYAKSLAAS